MAEDRVRAHAWVRGRVQGVWFRQSTADRAAVIGVGGWVRNVPDDSVEAVFEGTRAQVELALDYVRIGPEHARVDDVEVAWETPLRETTFSVR